MRETSTGYEGTSELAAWLGVFGGPILWGLHLGVGYTLVTLPCISDIDLPRSVLYILTAVTAIGAFACVVTAAMAWRRSGLQLEEDWGEGGGRIGFLAALGIMFSGVSLMAIVVQSFALPFASYCE